MMSVSCGSDFSLTFECQREFVHAAQESGYPHRPQTAGLRAVMEIARPTHDGRGNPAAASTRRW
jgi:hypothetical protein